MAKIYFKKPSNNNQRLKPKAETIDFLINYSKATSVLKVKDYFIEINKN